MLIAIVATTLLGFPQGTGIESNQRLAKPISCRFAILSLEDLAKDLSKKTGVPLSARRTIADRKVTVVFKDRPAAEAMRMIGTAMLMEWKPTSDGGYRLDLTPKAAEAERTTEPFERQRLRRNLRHGLVQLRRLVRMTKEERAAELQRVDAELQRPRAAGSSQSVDDLERIRLALRSRGFLELLAPLAGDLEKVEETLLSGQSIYASTKPADPLPKLDLDALQEALSLPQMLSAYGRVYLNFEYGSIAASFYDVTEGSYMNRGGPGVWILRLEGDRELNPLESLMEAWSGRPIDRKWLDRPLKPSAEPPVDPGYAEKLYTTGEHLVHLAERAEIPLVADAFRSPVSRMEWLAGDTAAKYLAALASSHPFGSWAPSRFRYRTEGGWLLIRHRDGWNRLRKEIPERLLRPMEARWTLGQPLTLAVWTQFLGALSDQQAAPLRVTPSSLTRFPKQGVASAITMLRLYASLDEADRIRVRSGGLPLSGLDARRREIAVRAIWELGERGALGPAYLHAQVPGRSLPEEIWFVVTEDSSPAGNWFHEPEVPVKHPRSVYRFELRPLGGSAEGILAVDRG